MDTVEYKNALSRFVTGVTLVAARPEVGRPAEALTVNSFTSVSLTPPIILWCLGRDSQSWARFADINVFSVNVLKEGEAARAMRHAEHGIQLLDEADITTGPTGAPVLSSALASIDCRVRTRTEMGDHRVFFADVVDLVSRDGAPLCYYRGAYRSLKPV